MTNLRCDLSWGQAEARGSLESSAWKNSQDLGFTSSDFPEQGLHGQDGAAAEQAWAGPTLTRA